MVKSGLARLKKLIAKYDDLAYYYRIKSQQSDIQDAFSKVSLKIAKIDENVYAFLNIYPLKWGKKRIWQKYFRKIVNKWDLLTANDKQYFIKLLQLYKVPYDIIEKSEEKVEELKTLYEFCDPNAIHLQYFVEVSQNPEKRLEYETELVKDTYILDDWVYKVLRQDMNEKLENYVEGGKTDKICHSLSEYYLTKLPLMDLDNDGYVDLEGVNTEELPIASECGVELALDIYITPISSYESEVAAPLEYDFSLPISLTSDIPTTYGLTLSFFLTVEAQAEAQGKEISINTSYELALS